MSEKILVAQSGGPTAAINATLSGVIGGALEAGAEIYGAENGIKGVMEDRTVHLNPVFEHAENRALLRTTPSSYLGSCRYKLPEGEDAVYRDIFEKLDRDGITRFLYIGGNDSMDTVGKLSSYAKKHGIGISIVGVPKTIDNDLVGTDHTPGFGSAAKYVAATVREIARDSAVYAERSVTVVEIMGRNAGWLTAASSLARCSTSLAPHLIYLPERPVSAEKILSDIEHCPARNMIVAVSEGVKNEKGEYFCADEAGAHDIFGHAQLAGASRVIAGLVKNRFHYKTRGIELNIPQRCGAHFASETDLFESERIGRAGVLAALAGKTGISMGFERTCEYQVKIVENDVLEVANKERRLPDAYIHPDANDVTDAFLTYARPLILGEPQLMMEDGLPKHIALRKF